MAYDENNDKLLVELGEVELSPKMSIVLSIRSYEGADEDGEPTSGEPKLVMTRRIMTAKKGPRFKPVGRMTETEVTGVLALLTQRRVADAFKRARKELEAED